MHSQVEDIIVLVYRHPRATSNVSLGLITEILSDDGRLISTERLRGSSNMERGGNILKLHFLNGDPEV